MEAQKQDVQLYGSKRICATPWKHKDNKMMLCNSYGSTCLSETGSQNTVEGSGALALNNMQQENLQ
jgi:hypothetical protein